MGMFVGMQLFLLLIGFALVAVWVWALIDILKSKFKEDLMQIVWLLVVFFLPFLGVILYLLVGRSMKISDAPANDDPSARYDHLAKLKTLLDEGVITPEEFETEKQKILRS
ncbi:MAG: SHOCT domain-containing protein [Sulfuricurvum sp.]